MTFRIRLLVLTATALLALGGCAGKGTIDRTRLVDLDGHRHSVQSLSGAKATVFVFVAVDCPIANRCLPEITALSQELAGVGVRFITIYASPLESAQQVRQHRIDYALAGPAYRDTDFALARQVGARFTPEAVAIAADGRLIYQGRINDQFLSLGQSKPAPTRHDLAEALRGYLAGDPPCALRAAAVGCTFRAP